MFVFGGISEEIGKEHLVLRYIRFISTKSYTIRLSKYSKTNIGSSISKSTDAHDNFIIFLQDLRDDIRDNMAREG